MLSALRLALLGSEASQASLALLGAQLGSLAVRRTKPGQAWRKATDGDLCSQKPPQDTRARGAGDPRPCEAWQGPSTTCPPQL